jgi:carboxypeptidase Q
MKRTITFLCLFLPALLSAQVKDSILIRRIFDEALTSREAYENLRWLCKHTKGRIAGTPEAAAAVEFTRQVMLDMGLDSVYLQELMVKRWVRGDTEFARITSSRLGSEDLSITGLGTSVGTNEWGILARVIEVHSFGELQKLGKERIRGKIVFFNRPMDPTLINIFRAYGEAVDQRVSGASEAAKYGAAAAIIRSVTTAIDDHPHTGVMVYEAGIPQIPAVCVSTLGANLLSLWLKQDPELNLHLISNCKTYPDVSSYNVIGELRGSVHPDEIITVGGHLDAWDIGEGAHDDGAGCIQSIEALRLFKAAGIRPKRTVRAVMFMDEEIAQRGANKYAELAKLNHEKHYAALESDRGGFMPRGFGFNAEGDRLERMLELVNYFKPYGITEFTSGGGGEDIDPLKESGAVLISLVPDMQRYGDYHHSPIDTFEQVNIRELQFGSASIAAIIYLIDQYDL